MFHRTISRCLIAASLAATLLPAPAHGLSGQLPGSQKPSSATRVAPRKPIASVHPDVAPRLPGGLAGSTVTTRTAVSGGVARRPDGSGRGAKHPVAYAEFRGLVTSAIDGRNGVSFSYFDNGDMVVVSDMSSITGHAGIFDHRYYTGLSSLAVWSANVAPTNGVQRESCEKFRAYDRAYALWVPSEANHGVAARDFAARQVRKPYNLFAAKTDYTSFYCSKLAWAAWRTTSGLDLDADGGYWVWPVDLVNSRYTACFGFWS